MKSSGGVDRETITDLYEYMTGRLEAVQAEAARLLVRVAELERRRRTLIAPARRSIAEPAPVLNKRSKRR